MLSAHVILAYTSAVGGSYWNSSRSLQTATSARRNVYCSSYLKLNPPLYRDFSLRLWCPYTISLSQTWTASRPWRHEHLKFPYTQWKTKILLAPSSLYQGRNEVCFFATDSIFLPKMLLWSQKGWEFLSLNPILLLAWFLIPWKTRLIPIPRVVIPNPAALIPDPGPFQGFDSWSRIPRYDPALQFGTFNCHSPPINYVNWHVLKLKLDDNSSLFFVLGLFRNFFTLSEA